MDELQELTQDFLVEAFEMIEKLDQDLVELETRPDDLELLNGIFRVAHTIKGSSSFLNFDVLTYLTHHMEDVLNQARKGDLKIDAGVMDVVLESVDAMKSLLTKIRDTGNDKEHGLDIEGIVARLAAVVGGTPAPAPQPAPAAATPAAPAAAPATPAPAAPAAGDPDYSKMSDKEVEDEIARLLAIRQAEDKKRREEKVASGAAIAPVAAPVAPAPAPQAAPPPPPPIAPKPAAPAAAPATPATPAAARKDNKTAPAAAGGQESMMEQTIRVDVNRLDHLMNLIGELVLGKNRLLKIYDDVEERYEGEKFLEELNQVVSSISMVTTDLQTAVMKTRMLAIGKVFNKFPRMIRDLARELNKKIDLQIKGEETEMDKSIVEVIGDPLVHIIRNSADHGIEDPETRARLGKPDVGKVELKAYNEGNSIVIEIVDDGKGLDVNLLKNKALEKGLISEKECEMMSQKEAYGLIFKAGLSTSAKVTNISGRGVGMDVVKTNIEKLNGIIEVDSELGKGTIIKLKIPLTLAIIQSLMVGTQEEFYAIPLSCVLETVRINEDDIFSVEGRSVMRLRNEVLSLVKLSEIFNVDQVMDDSEYTYVVVLGLAESKLGLIVDVLVGQEEIVIKSLGEYLKGIDGIAGATVRGDGGVTLIADVVALMHMAKKTKSPAPGAKATTVSKAKVAKQKTKPSDYTILVIDDSKTDRAIMRQSIAPMGVSIVEAADGVEALGIIKSGEHDFDACLVDIEMPRMDGYTLASEIRKYSRFKSLPLIAVTSRTSKTDRMRGVEVGMTEYITKPYSPEYLMNVVKRNTHFNLEAGQ
ncbi:MAG: response regulator [Helicobacteraceae bacterium]|jgi:two-component system chemotaxis sensor kinase CheA|nr:response regulator [Helicobacteraceae bacterium]